VQWLLTKEMLVLVELLVLIQLIDGFTSHHKQQKELGSKTLVQ
jgi:hypothetical protein